MSPIWIIPALVLPTGGIAVAALLRQTAAAARALAVEVDRLGEIAVAAAVAWDGVVDARASFEGVRRGGASPHH
jgi:hypothetical protein